MTDDKKKDPPSVASDYARKTVSLSKKMAEVKERIHFLRQTEESKQKNDNATDFVVDGGIYPQRCPSSDLCDTGLTGFSCNDPFLDPQRYRSSDLCDTGLMGSSCNDPFLYPQQDPSSDLCDTGLMGSSSCNDAFLFPQFEFGACCDDVDSSLLLSSKDDNADHVTSFTALLGCSSDSLSSDSLSSDGTWVFDRQLIQGGQCQSYLYDGFSRPVGFNSTSVSSTCF